MVALVTEFFPRSMAPAASLAIAILIAIASFQFIKKYETPPLQVITAAFLGFCFLIDESVLQLQKYHPFIVAIKMPRLLSGYYWIRQTGTAVVLGRIASRYHITYLLWSLWALYYGICAISSLARWDALSLSYLSAAIPVTYMLLSLWLFWIWRSAIALTDPTTIAMKATVASILLIAFAALPVWTNSIPMLAKERWEQKTKTILSQRSVRDPVFKLLQPVAPQNMRVAAAGEPMSLQWPIAIRKKKYFASASQKLEFIWLNAYRVKRVQLGCDTSALLSRIESASSTYSDQHIDASYRIRFPRTFLVFVLHAEWNGMEASDYSQWDACYNSGFAIGIGSDQTVVWEMRP